ncbi:aminotransferase family protein [Caldalkalibacillus mannanilyticus]|uniref:aminotransferase family protein n=1 Tax=Caldalkalibacillus mannanilyticus TaxID=1418 RepID=UPI00046A8E62|nr:aminotransferase class III-fold pyridoxal phosphate-dependent enzyme [Caldalkalibacillus mannanilyticus]
MQKYSIIHPFLPASREVELKELTKADGILLFDIEGKKYIDAIAGLFNFILGYNNKEIIESIYEQVQQLPFINMWSSTNRTISSLADALIEKTQFDFEKVMYTCTGSESVELTIKLIRRQQYFKGNPNKKHIAVFDASYHGSYYGSFTATGLDKDNYAPYAPMLNGFVYLPVPFLKNNQFTMQNHLQYLEEFFKVNGGLLGGVIIEPVVGPGGMLPIPEIYLQKLMKLCREHDVIVAFDEVSTGFYRTGEAFCYQSFKEIKPDILCLSKGINGGYLPLGAVLLNKNVVDQFGNEGVIMHFSTQNGNPTCCAAALKVLQLLEEGNYGTVVKEKGEYFERKLKTSLENIKCVTDIRVTGLMIGIEITNSGQILSFDEVWDIMKKLKEEGLLVYPFSTKYSSGFSMMPPYIIAVEEIDEIVDIIMKVLRNFK